MKILITGAAGFIGQLVAKRLLDDDSSHTLVLTDIAQPPIPSGVKNAQNARAVTADLSTQSSLVVEKDINAVYIFHGIMSSGAEENFELGGQDLTFFNLQC